jgi:hypothetical protein
MDEVTRNMCVAQLKNADAHPEKPEVMNTAIVSSLIAVVDCQYTTGKRVKRMVVWLVGVAVVLLVNILLGSDAALQLVKFARGGC